MHRSKLFLICRAAMVVLVGLMTLARSGAQPSPLPASPYPEVGDETWLREMVLNSRRDMAMAYHASCKQIVLFGGTDRNTSFGDTWVWNGKGWFPRRPVESADARYAHAMVYDAKRKVTVLFGGVADDGSSLNDTWEWDGKQWKKKVTLHAPGPRFNHAMTYDAVRSRVVLFGGETGYADTWEYDGNDWVEIKTRTSPPALRGHAMAFDGKNGVTVLFGGKAGGVGYGRSTWIYNGSDWMEIPAGTQSILPAGRREHVMVSSDSSGHVILFGGYFHASATDVWLNDIWAWNGSTWTLVSPVDGKVGPAPRYYHAAAFDEAGGQLVVFGGSHSNDNVILLSDTWLYSFGYQDTGWVCREGQSPTARSDHAMSYDVKRRQVVLFGGDDGEEGHSVLRDDTWIWNNVTWRQHNGDIQPSGRRDHEMTFDLLSGHHLLFGGDDGVRRLSDTWTFDGEKWTLLSPASSPPPRSRHAQASMSLRGRTVVFGGFDGSVKLGDTWEWDGKAWSEIKTPQAPMRRSRAAMAYDLLRRKVVLFGGKGPGNIKLNDTWEYDGKTWVEIRTATPPSARIGHAMAYDMHRRKVILVGGQDESGRLGDTYAWDGKDWKKIKPVQEPPVRSRHTLVYNAARQRVVMFGGYGTAKPVSDTWSFLPIRMWAKKCEVVPGEVITFEAKLLEEAGKFYVCALAFDRAPGVPLPISAGEVDLPLKPDALTAASLQFKGFSGILDKDGKAFCSVKVDGNPVLVGIRFFASLLTYDASLELGAVTNEVPLAIVK